MTMRTINFVLIVVCGILSAFAISCNNTETKKDVANAPVSKDSLIKRGEYLVSIIGCDHCHSPKKLTPQGPVIDLDNRFSGYPADRPFGKVDSNIIKNGKVVFSADLLAAAGPWGVSFAANISGDETGIGNWTEDQFKKAITQGKWKGMDGGRMLLPPMPWESFKNLKDEDVSAIFEFLKSTKPVKNIEPAPKQLSEL